MGIKDEISPEEWRVRVELAALYRAFAHFGWTDLTYTHLSARVPGASDLYLINPYGLLFEEVTASTLIKVDFAGHVVDGSHGYNRAGHFIHSAVLQARPELQFILHSHTRAAVAVSAMACGLLPLSQPANVIRGSLGMHRYTAVEDNPDERTLLTADLGNRYLLLLHNHGLLACGRTAAEAFLYHYFAEQAFQIQVDVLASGQPWITPAEGVVADLSAWGAPRATPWGEKQWAAVCRLLERQDPSFKA